MRVHLAGARLTATPGQMLRAPPGAGVEGRPRLASMTVTSDSPFGSAAETAAAPGIDIKPRSRTVTDGIVKLAIEANGLAWSVGVTPYQLCMYYDDGLDGSGYLRAPNYTHWWLKIDGGGAAGHNDGIEAFPGSTVITIRRPEYSVNHVYRIYLAGLHPSHVQRIDATLHHVVRGAHNAHGPGHGPWAPDNSRNTCSICGDAFTLFNRRHHCRCCGQLVCSDCSPNARPGVARVHHPNNNDGNGPQRVCLYCE